MSPPFPEQKSQLIHAVTSMHIGPTLTQVLCSGISLGQKHSPGTRWMEEAQLLPGMHMKSRSVSVSIIPLSVLRRGGWSPVPGPKYRHPTDFPANFQHTIALWYLKCPGTRSFPVFLLLSSPT